MRYVVFLLRIIIIVALLTLTVLALYKAISIPGSKKLKCISEDRKLTRRTMKKIIVVNIIFVVFLSIVGILLQ